MTLWQRYPKLAYLAVLFGVFGHSSSEFVSVLTGLAGPELSVWRFLLGGAGLVLLALLLPASRDLLTPLRKCPLRLLILSLLGVTAGYLFFHWSLDFASVVQVATMVTTIPIFVALINLILNRQPIETAKLITAAAATVGVALLLTDGYLAKLAGSAENFFGVLLALCCAALVAGYSVAARPMVSEYGALRITTLTTALGALGLWLVVGIVWGVWVNPLALFQRPTEQSSALLILALWNTTITQFLWIGGLAAVPDITRGSYLFFLKPVIAAGLAVLILQQTLSWMQSLAILVICSAVALEVLWPRAAITPPATHNSESPR